MIMKDALQQKAGAMPKNDYNVVSGHLMEANYTQELPQYILVNQNKHIAGSRPQSQQDFAQAAVSIDEYGAQSIVDNGSARRTVLKRSHDPEKVLQPPVDYNSATSKRNSIVQRLLNTNQAKRDLTNHHQINSSQFRIAQLRNMNVSGLNCSGLDINYQQERLEFMTSKSETRRPQTQMTTRRESLVNFDQKSEMMNTNLNASFKSENQHFGSKCPPQAEFLN